MGRLHKSVVLLLGDRVQELHPKLENRVQRRLIEDGGLFPEQLIGVLPLTNNDLGHGIAEHNHAVERLLNRVNDALEIMQLTKERGISVGNVLEIHLVVPSCDAEGRRSLVEVIEQVHRICLSNNFLFRVHAFVMMPGLYNDAEDADPDLYRGRALATLFQLNQLMRSEAEPWRDNAPLNNIWLVDSRNERGEFIGYQAQALEMIAELIISMAADDLEGLHQGASRATEGCFFRSFGFSEVWLPVETLQHQIADHFVAQALRQKVIPAQRIQGNELLLSVKQYCHQAFSSADRILEQVGTNPDGSSYFEPFDLTVDDEDLAIDAYLSLFSEKVAQYDGETALQAKQMLHERAEQVMSWVHDAVQAKLGDLIDEEARGTRYAQAFLEELLGYGDASELTEGPRFETPSNLASRWEELFAHFLENLGISAYQEELAEVSNRLTELRAEQRTLQARADLLRRQQEIEAEDEADDEAADADAAESAAVDVGEEGDEAAYTAEAPARDVSGTRLGEVAAEIERLSARQCELQELVDLSKEAAEDVEASQSLRQKAETERRSYLHGVQQQLRDAGHGLRQAREQLSYLLGERPHAQRRYFLHYPIGFLIGVAAALSYLFYQDIIAFPSFLGNRVTWQILTVIVLGFGTFILWRYYAVSLSHIRRIRQEIKRLEQRVSTLQADLRRGYRELYTNIFTQYRDQVALNEFHECFTRLDDLLKDLKAFNAHLETWHAREDFSELDTQSLTSLPLLTATQFRRLASEFIVEEELDRESERVLSPSLSDLQLSQLVWHGEDGADELISSLQAWGGELAERKLQGLGAEEILFDDRFQELRDQANLDPHEILKMLSQIAPALQVEDELGGGAELRHEIGVADVERSWLRAYLDSSIELYSHYDHSRLTAFAYVEPVAFGSLSKLSYFVDSLTKVAAESPGELGLSEEDLAELQEMSRADMAEWA